ncbi:restriction endonuclease [Mariluticola halotolerans]|uniref:restriction endonuclease n=1 Tax=Mariluticola halotolerans TaxID=2909283 RepID=UPI0026E2ECD8|nr:restriction endonuclease [Mariluticola halotolerans]UJQ93354.1 restriction endonuclease [Mariluticola halotolerans]
MPVWVARAGRNGEQEQYALSNNVAVAGWDDAPDFAAVKSREQLLPLLVETYSEEAENKLKNWETQIWAFSNRIAIGDLVILPRKRTSTVAIGKVTGTYRFVTDAPAGCKHQIPIEWIKKDIPRQSIDSDLRFSIGGAMTVFQVSRNRAEDRFRAMLEGRTLSVGNDRKQEAVSEGEDISAPDLERIATDQISDHISRKFRGHELERLVEAVLIAQGFVTDRTDEGADGGVDILCGKGSLGLESPRMCVQVKSQDGALDVKVVRELQGVLSTFGADLGLIVAWGGFTSKADDEARRNFFKIRLWTPDTLISQLVSVYDKLPEDIQKDLPLKRIWTLVQD